MASTAREDVFADPFEHLVRGFLFRTLSSERSNAARFRMDVSENEIAYRVRADLPGARTEGQYRDHHGRSSHR
jgi:HSP20 family molecular chaperone IbpA